MVGVACAQHGTATTELRSTRRQETATFMTPKMLFLSGVQVIELHVYKRNCSL